MVTQQIRPAQVLGGTGVTAVVRRATGSGIAVAANTSWNDLDTSLDLTLAAAVGDWVTAEPMGAWAAVGGTYGALDVVTVVSASPVNSFSTGGAPDAASFGTYAWGGSGANFYPFSGALRYQLQAGDISAGTVTLRLRVRTSSAVAKSIHCSSTEPFIFSAHVGP